MRRRRRPSVRRLPPLRLIVRSSRLAIACSASTTPEGYWCGELQGDSILESEYILLKFILGQESDPCLAKIGQLPPSLQQADGGWNLYPGGKSDLSGSVKAYFALKLMGDDPQSPHMLRPAAAS